MWIYFLILSTALVMSFQRPRLRSRHFALLTFFVVLWVFTGLRDEIGPDWTGYGYIYEGVVSRDWSAITDDREPGFFLINRVSDYFGWGLYGVNAICAGLFLTGVFRYATRTANAWLAAAAVLPFLVFIISMSGVRQAAAIGLAFSILAEWKNASLFRKILVISLAATIHNSAIILFVFIIWDGGRYPWLRFFLGSIAVFLAVRVLDQSGAMDVYSQRYLEKNVESSGAFYHVALSAAPALLYLVFRRKIAAHGWYTPLMSRACFFSLALLPMVVVSSTGTSRIALYLSFVQMWIFPAFVAANGRRWVMATGLCAIYFLAIFLVYFTFSVYVSSYVPYRNVWWSP